MRGDQTLFAREDSVEAAWRVVDPIIGDRSVNLPLCFYEAGSWGPPEADAFMPDGWHEPNGDLKCADDDDK